MLKAARIGVGDIAEVEIDFDKKPRDVPMPSRFAEALKNDEIAKSQFEKLSPSRQKEILRYLGFLKTDDSLIRNVERVICHLRGDDAPTLHVLMRRDKPG